MVTLYTTHCPKCSVIEKKLKQKNIEFFIIDDTSKVVEFGKEYGVKSAPILVVNDKVMQFKEANDWINTIEAV